MKHTAALIYVSYVLTASVKFNETLQNIVKGLQSSGFSEKDYREMDALVEEEKKKPVESPLETFLFRELQESEKDEIETERISFVPEMADKSESKPGSLEEIETMAETQNQESLLTNFKLSADVTKIDFGQITSDLYKVDIEQIKKEEYAPRFTKIEAT